MGKHYCVLSREERIKLEGYVQAGEPVKRIAELLGRSKMTVYRELKRGRYVKRNSDWTESESYSSDLAQERYEKAVVERGAPLKIGNNLAVIHFLEDLIGNQNYSPYAAAVELKKDEAKYGLTLSKTTIYSYIRKDLFLNLTMSSLPEKKEPKKNRKQKVQKHASKGVSIEKRPEEIATREEFGNWEMDTVVGKQGVSKKSLLVLTERKTRKEIIKILRTHTTKDVVHVLDRIERKIGEKRFRSIFKTITVDNGSEFQDYQGMIRSRRNKQNRTQIFYCHPYSSYERGSNENQNRMIRRFIPKGTDMDQLKSKDVKTIEQWMNNYPRRLLHGRTANELFQAEIAALAFV